MWKVRVGRNHATCEFDILIFSEHDGRREFIQPVDLIGKLKEEGVPVKPTFSINEFEATEMLTALVDALRVSGIKATNEPNDVGELAATKYHLEDMRSLMKLAKK